MIRMDYHSQWDADAQLSIGDCGIVSASILARWRGANTTPDDMLTKAGLPIARHSYTFNEVRMAARVVKLALEYHHPVTWLDIKAELNAGRPVIPLLRYGALSGNQDKFTGAHFFVCLGYDSTHVIVHDPNFWSARRDEGAYRRIPLSEFNNAIGDALIPTGNMALQSMFFVP